MRQAVDEIKFSYLPARAGSSTNYDFSTLSLKCLAGDFSQALELFADAVEVLRSPVDEQLQRHDLVGGDRLVDYVPQVKKVRLADLSGATDDASLVERLGEPVYVVEGDPCNVKVTCPADLKLLRAILGVKPPAERAAHKRF